MKYTRYSGLVYLPVILIILLISFFLTGSFNEHIISSCITDLNRNGEIETIRLVGGNRRFGEYLTITEYEQVIFRIDLTSLKPWKVQIADVDGDGEKELSISVYKTTRSDPEMKKRPFIYDWGEKGIHPKWLGSRLSRPFDDYIFCDLDEDGMDELIAIENLVDGTKLLNAYKWKGFGFEGLCESPAYLDIRELEVNLEGGEPPVAVIRENNRWKSVVIHYEEDTIILK